MKKLFLIFVTFFSLILAGCAPNDQKVTRFDAEETNSDENTQGSVEQIAVTETPSVENIPTTTETDPSETAPKPIETETTDNQSTSTPTNIANENINENEAEPVLVENQMQEEQAENTTVTEAKEEAPNQNKPKTGALAITSLKNNQLETTQSYNVIEGTAPEDTYSLTINGYKLRKYTPGKTTWNFIASTQLNNLKGGENKFVVKALDKENKEIDSVNFTINYGKIDSHALPNVGPNMVASLLLGLFIFGLFRWRKLIN